MTTTEQKKHPHERKEFAFGISLGEWLIAALLGAGSGLVTASKTIRDHFHMDVKNSTEFKDHFNTRQIELDKIKPEQFSDKRAYWQAVSDKKRDFVAEYDELAWHTRKVRKNPILGTIDRFHGLSPRSKGSIYFSAFFGTAIGSAMVLSFFNGVATRDKIDKIEDAVANEKSR